MYGLRFYKVIPPDASDEHRYIEELRAFVHYSMNEEDGIDKLFDRHVRLEGDKVVCELPVADHEEGLAFKDFLETMREGGDPTSAAYKLYFVMDKIERRNNSD